MSKKTVFPDKDRLALLIETKMYSAIGGIYDKDIEMDSFIEQKKRAKECAKHCVDEIIEALTLGFFGLDDPYRVNSVLMYYHEVKHSKELRMLWYTGGGGFFKN